jgi:hypothetical protein
MKNAFRSEESAEVRLNPEYLLSISFTDNFVEYSARRTLELGTLGWALFRSRQTC